MWHNQSWPMGESHSCGGSFCGNCSWKKGDNVRVQCFKHPFSVNVPQLLECEQEAAFYKHVYHTDVTPKLKGFRRAWQYVY